MNQSFRSGIPNAIKIGKELEKNGKQLKSIRLDSGDLARLSIEGRKMLDEEVILHLKMQNAQIDAWGIGTKLITGSDWPAHGGVYKLVAREKDDGFHPVIKLSEDAVKITTPGTKKLYRIMNNKTNKSEGDYLAFDDEVVDDQPLKMFDPIFPHKYKYVEDYTAVELMKEIIKDGELVYDLPSIDEIRTYHNAQIKAIWPETLPDLNPQTYFVDLSQEVWQMKQDLIVEQS